jgi:glycosyltransferase involved in cell wall biosynthesis
MRINKTTLLDSGKTDELYIVYVSTFPPRKCGIATFTEDITRAMDEMLSPVIRSRIVALNPNDVLSYHYPRKVIFQMNQDNQEDYLRIADEINRMGKVQLVNIQHEFGIFGGEHGSYVIPFVESLKKPVVITFHTVLPDPDELLHRTVCSLAENVRAIIVMTNISKTILTHEYGIAARKIRVIPHGIQSQPYLPSVQAKMTLGYSDRVVLSTFGLMSRGKGLEYVIEALPAVVEEYPNFVYIILGATHPVVLKEEGESYRNYLIEKIYALGLYDYVKLYNRYFPLNELLHFLRATDIYISPSLEPNQASSGTLIYALGTGRPVISTAFTQAREVVTDDVGILVDFKDSNAYTEAILHLLQDEQLRLQMGQNAYLQTRYMVWPNIAVQYSKVFSEHAKKLVRISEQKSLPKIKLDHLIHLTDDFGIVQFAKLSNRDTSSGYTLDDNARALLATAMYYGKLAQSNKNQIAATQKERLLKLINIYLSFVEFTARADGSFQNYVKADRTLNRVLNEQHNLEETHGRALYSLALTSSVNSLPKAIKKRAFSILENSLSKGVSFDSPRAIALHVKALHILIKKKIAVEGVDPEQALEIQCDKLVHLFEETHTPDWQWFEKYLTYSNGILPESLLLGYNITRDNKYLQVGRQTLDFLIKASFIDGIYMPIGESGWYYRNSKSNRFDQQPEEVKSMVHALSTCHSLTKDESYLELMYKAFYWFLGDNSLRQVVYDRITGGCYDGVGRNEINLNQGAESTISYLLSRLAFE